MKKQQANWSFPTTIRFGVGRITELPAACQEVGMQRPLFVTDAGLANLEMTDQVLSLCRAEGLGIGLFTDVQPNPVEENLNRGIAIFREGQHDGIIAFGGGSALDCGKLIPFMAQQSRPVWDFEDIGDWWTRANPEGIAPIIAIPTTAGTGSEVGRAGVVTHIESRTKKVIFHPKMLPAIVIADPQLTVGMPLAITVGTGMDALAHCLEAYCSPSYHPMAEGIAVEGVRLALENLPKVVADGGDLEARGNMMSAAAMGAVAFQKGLGAIHSLSHPIGSLYNTHHGMTNAVFMPYVLDFNRSAIEAKIARLARYIGIEGGFDGFQEAILALRAECQVPTTLSEFVKVDLAHRDLIAEMAIVDPTAAGNPVPLTVDGAKAIFDAAQ
ncbi:MAG: iron-containing alcohol dehydrogenase [Chloroflexota bacterium]